MHEMVLVMMMHEKANANIFDKTPCVQLVCYGMWLNTYSGTNSGIHDKIKHAHKLCLEYNGMCLMHEAMHAGEYKYSMC